MGVNLNIPQQQQTPLAAGANSPQDSAIKNTTNMNAKQAALNSIGGKRIKRGGANNIEIPPTSTASYNVNGGVKNAVSTNLVSQANAEYDKNAYKMGGRRKSKRRRTRRRTNKKTKKTRRHKSHRYRSK